MSGKIDDPAKERVSNYPTPTCDFPSPVHAPGDIVRVTIVQERPPTEDGRPRPPLPVGPTGQFCPMHRDIAPAWLASLTRP